MANEGSAVPSSAIEGEVDSGASELSQAVSWFESEGIPIPEELAGFSATVEGEPEALPPEPQAPEPPLDDDQEADVQQPPAKNGFEQRRQGLKAAHATLQREHQEATAYNEALLATVLDLNAKLTALSGGAQPGQPAQQAPPEEDEADIIDNPDSYVNKRVEEKLVPYKRALATILQRMKGQDESAQVRQLVSGIENARIAHEKSSPGFVQRAEAYSRAFIEDAMFMGMPQQQAEAAFTMNVNKIIETAMRAGQNPIVALDKIASRFSNGAAPAPAARPVGVAPASVRAEVNSRIGAAVAASRNGAARPSIAPSTSENDEGPVTMAALRSGRVPPGKVRELLSQPHGEAEFWRMAKLAEEELG